MFEYGVCVESASVYADCFCLVPVVFDWRGQFEGRCGDLCDSERV